MSSVILEQSRSRERLDVDVPAPKHRKPLLVATDASEPSDAALRVAHAIAAATGQHVKLFAVHVPLPLVAAEAQIASTPQMEETGRAELTIQVQAQVERLRLGVQWPVEVVSGDPATTIANEAKTIGAEMVIMGLGGHGVFDLVFGDEMVLKVLRLGTVPVLAVAPGLTGLPKRVLAAVDFSASCVRALSLALPWLTPESSVTLAHVISPDLDPSNWNGLTAGYHGTVGRALDRVVAEMGFGNAARVQRRIFAGDPAKEMLKLVEELQPDLIIAGSHGHNFLTRLLLGSVSTRLIRRGHCSVLVAPPEDSLGYLDELPSATTQFLVYEWAERLEEFTRRNGGRIATLEIIDPAIGAQVEERTVPFAGAAFDPHDARVQIMFDGRGGEHLTHTISGVTAVQVLRDRAGKDLLLRVAHGRGQTLLTLER